MPCALVKAASITLVRHRIIPQRCLTAFIKHRFTGDVIIKEILLCNPNSLIGRSTHTSLEENYEKASHALLRQTVVRTCFRTAIQAPAGTLLDFCCSRFSEDGNLSLVTVKAIYLEARLWIFSICKRALLLLSLSK